MARRTGRKDEGFASSRARESVIDSASSAPTYPNTPFRNTNRILIEAFDEKLTSRCLRHGPPTRIDCLEWFLLIPFTPFLYGAFAIDSTGNVVQTKGNPLCHPRTGSTIRISS
ncbi:hypothetical protein X777_05266 [Ooceraea biroi]|uniref:Uncharacterized protein n=1 Tax=Ooceraea biroi TaxID=2015173 RepID=A0A026WHR1_OOCBI|nr:hypothetical protein X777_05266 [Ooceraea biroi]